MASFLQITCLILLIGLVHNWESSSNHFRGSNDDNSPFVSIFDDMNKMMALMNQRFQRLFGFSSFPTDQDDNWMEDRTKLDGIKPVCTTTINSPSMQKTRRKKLRNTQTTTCVKELILDGKKQLYKEMNTTDDKGILISQSKSYQTIIIHKENNTMPINTDQDRNVISY
jgi:hypothetical protein